MDDFNISSLHESKNEWAARLLTILTPLVIEGFKSIFEESLKLCKDNNEIEKYLMTFQNFITRIPKWNSNVIDQEKKRVIEKSHCNYLEELVTCVHIIQLKILTAMRVGQKQKKIDINIPKLEDFIHKIYINSARKLYKNVYLFEINIHPLQVQKNNREMEIIIQECILNTVRDSIPIESILKAYMDETIEEDVVEEIKEQIIEESVNSNSSEHIIETENPKKEEQIGGLKFNDMDSVMDTKGNEEIISAPKSIDRLEEISAIRNAQRKQEEEEEEDNDKIKILDQNVDITGFEDLGELNDIKLNDSMLLDDIEILT
jgi:hypothetical protein